MSLLDRLFGRGRSGKPATGEIDLAVLISRFAEMIPYYETVDVARDLTRARLAEACRDADLEPPTAAVVTAATDALDGEGWRRLALIVSALDVPEVRAVLPVAAADIDVDTLVESGLVGVAAGLSLLTLELLHQSSVRTEEFARSWLACLGVGIVGETREESRGRLERLDYGRLLADVERARKAAEERTEELRKQLEQQAAQRGRRRGTWYAVLQTPRAYPGYRQERLARYRFHTGAPLRPLQPDEICPVLFLDIGPHAMRAFLGGRLVFLQPLALHPWHAGVDTIYVADAERMCDVGTIGFVPGHVPLADAARKLVAARTVADVRESFGGVVYDQLLLDHQHRLTALERQLDTAEELAEPVRRRLQSGTGDERQAVRAQLQRLGVTEDDLCAAWHHVSRPRRDHLVAALRELSSC